MIFCTAKSSMAQHGFLLKASTKNSKTLSKQLFENIEIVVKAVHAGIMSECENIHLLYVICIGLRFFYSLDFCSLNFIEADTVSTYRAEIFVGLIT